MSALRIAEKSPQRAFLGESRTCNENLDPYGNAIKKAQPFGRAFKYDMKTELVSSSSF